MAVHADGSCGELWSRVRLSVAGLVVHRSNVHGGMHETTRHFTAPTWGICWLHWP